MEKKKKSNILSFEIQEFIIFIYLIISFQFGLSSKFGPILSIIVYKLFKVMSNKHNKYVIFA